MNSLGSPRRATLQQLRRNGERLELVRPILLFDLTEGEMMVQLSAPTHGQLIAQRFGDGMPEHIRELVGNVTWLADLARSIWPEMEVRTTVYDATSQRKLWERRHTYAEAAELEDSGRMLLVGFRLTKQSMPEFRSLEMWDLPILAWSPWWSRAAGIVTALAAWYLLQRGVRRSNQVEKKTGGPAGPPAKIT